MEGECAQSSSCLNQGLGAAGHGLALWWLRREGSGDVLGRLVPFFCFLSDVLSGGAKQAAGSFGFLGFFFVFWSHVNAAVTEECELGEMCMVATKSDMGQAWGASSARCYCLRERDSNLTLM